MTDSELPTEALPPSPASQKESAEAEPAEAVERICASSSFQKARVLRELLAYLWRNRDTEISEYQIGTEVLGRRKDFDPKLDATVRVNVARLRQRLHFYYDAEGKDDPIRMSIPSGAYRVAWTAIQNAEPGVAPPSGGEIVEPKTVAGASPYWRWVAVASIVASLAIGLHDWSISRKLHLSVPAVHPFWTEALDCRPAYSIVVPSPQFFLWREGRFVARDFRVNSHDQIASSAMLERLRERWGEPETTSLYTITTDTVASGGIARYLQDRGVGVDILTKSNVSQSILEERDAILMFAAANSGQYEPFIQPLSFRFASGGLLNLKPKKDEPDQWTGQSLAQEHSISYGLIASLPSRTGLTRQILLVSTQNHALAALLTSAPLLQEAFEYWRQHGSARFFEMVIRFEVKGMTTLRAAPIAIHGWQSNIPYILQN